MIYPKHIAFILDGNGRWAKKRGLPRNAGHREGAKTLKATIENLLELKIQYASFFMFSTENWKRSKEEVDGLFALADEYLNENSDYFTKNDIKVTFFGDKSVFDKKFRQKMLKIEEKTKNCKTLNLGMCINYGGREDIVKAVNEIISEGKKKVTPEDISKHLYSKDFPDPDFVVRTSGEQRISNFMLYQMAYSELYFPKCYWPDFNKKQLLKSLKVFSKRNRRFGGNQ